MQKRSVHRWAAFSPSRSRAAMVGCFILLSTVCLIGCGSTDDLNQSGGDSNNPPDAPGAMDMSFVPPKPIGNSDAGHSVGDPCNLWANVEDQRLLSKLHEELKNSYRPISADPDFGGTLNRYTTARKMMFTQVERFQSPDGPYIVECVYTGMTAPAPQTEDPNRDLVNCEHVMPRARMGDKVSQPILYSHQQSDMHNLLPATPGSNSTRGSFPFGRVVRSRNLDHMPSILGESASGQTVWEPRSERRGDVARITFYMSVRWGFDIGSEEEATLRDWNRNDPPDNRETIRNQSIAGLQGNRNPFIDCSTMVDRIPDFFAFQTLDTNESLPAP